MSTSVRENNKQLNRFASTGREKRRPRWWQCPGNRVKLLRRQLLFFPIVNLPLSRRFITQGALSNTQEYYYVSFFPFFSSAKDMHSSYLLLAFSPKMAFHTFSLNLSGCVHIQYVLGAVIQNRCINTHK